jgi:hypothetical protein
MISDDGQVRPFMRYCRSLAYTAFRQATVRINTRHTAPSRGLGDR